MVVFPAASSPTTQVRSRPHHHTDNIRQGAQDTHGPRRQLTHQDPHLLLPKQPTEDTGERETHPGSSLRVSETEAGGASAPVVDLMTIAEGLVRSTAGRRRSSLLRGGVT